MNVSLPNGASGFYPAPTNHIDGDPTPYDQAVYMAELERHRSVFNAVRKIKDDDADEDRADF